MQQLQQSMQQLQQRRHTHLHHLLLLRCPDFKTSTLQGASVLEVCVCVYI
jgi:hypothetical protein